MTELSGLANIIGNAGTLHGIEEPPNPAEWRTTDEYEAAYSAWYDRTHYWHATKQRPVWHDDASPIEIPWP